MKTEKEIIKQMTKETNTIKYLKKHKLTVSEFWKGFVFALKWVLE